MSTAVLDAPSVRLKDDRKPQATPRPDPLSGMPITSLVAKPSKLVVMDEPMPGMVAENDTLYAGSGDSDTV